VVQENRQLKGQIREIVEERVGDRMLREEDKLEKARMQAEVERLKEKLRIEEFDKEKLIKDLQDLTGVKDKYEREREERDRIEKERAWIEIQMRTKETEVEE
jgi:hypothetical protein